MKSLAGQEGRIPKDLKVNWELCRRYAMSLPVSAVICGLQTSEELQGIVRIARNFKPLTEDEVHQLLVDFARRPPRTATSRNTRTARADTAARTFDAVLKKASVGRFHFPCQRLHS